ncbi:MAG: biopolymer transporter ExbD [Pseudomonadota bacterium]
MSPNSEPNVIPFIDIMLVMLIIFMVAAPKPTVDIKVDLPPPGPVVYTPPGEDKATVITVLDVGGVPIIRIGEEVVTKDQFESALMRIAAANNPTMRTDLGKLFTDAKIFVDGDKEASYFSVVDVINEIDTVGFKKVSLLVKEEGA